MTRHHSRMVSMLAGYSSFLVRSFIWICHMMVPAACWHYMSLYLKNPYILWILSKDYLLDLSCPRFSLKTDYLHSGNMHLRYPPKTRLDGVTMKLEHTKNAESHIRGCSVAQQVHLLSQLRILELMGTRSLPTPGLCQPRSLPEP